MPYTPIFVDMTESDDTIVLGSTVTPFVLAIKTAELLLRKAFDELDPPSTRLEDVELSVEDLAIQFRKRFKGIHFSNRKALGSGVYAVSIDAC